METCDKWCIANFNGNCAAEHCYGEIRSIARPFKTAEQAASEYATAKSMLDFAFEKAQDNGE